MALASPVALKLAAGIALAIALAVASADPGRPPEGRTSIAVSRGEGNRWVVARSSSWRLPWGPVVERTCSRGYSFRARHWQDLGCTRLQPAR